MNEASRVADTLSGLAEAFRGAGPPDASMSPRRRSILAHLDRTDPTMVTELAEHLGVTPSTMSLTITRLEHAGLVRRERDPDDGRVVNVRLSDRGARARDAQAVWRPDRIERALAALSPAERRQAVRGLELLREGSQRAAAGANTHAAGLTEA